METYKKQVEIRWSDLDPNFHLRHSVYYDWGAYCRISFLNEYGCAPSAFIRHHLGPILFREECVFKREIHFEDNVEINVQIVKISKDASRWTLMHEIWKNGETLSAIITIDGAWIDTEKRKLTKPPQFVIDTFGLMPKVTGFRFTN